MIKQKQHRLPSAGLRRRESSGFDKRVSESRHQWPIAPETEKDRFRLHLYQLP